MAVAPPVTEVGLIPRQRTAPWGRVCGRPCRGGQIRHGQNGAVQTIPEADFREVTAAHANVRRARDLKAQRLPPVDIGKIIGASRATVYRNRSMTIDELD